MFLKLFFSVNFKVNCFGFGDKYKHKFTAKNCVIIKFYVRKKLSPCQFCVEKA